MMDFLLLPALLGAVFTVALCAIRCRRREPPFWLAAISAIATGVSTLLLSYGLSLFTISFWSDGKAEGWALVVTVFGLASVTSLVASLLVVLLYRSGRDEAA